MGLSLRSRRRGLRNSLRSDSPHPFSSVSLVSSPPDKGGIGVCVLACILTPSPCGHSPYIPCRNTGGRGLILDFVAADVLLTPPSFGHLPYILRCKTQGRRVNSITPTSGIFNPSPRRYAPQFSPIFSCENTGEKVGY